MGVSEARTFAGLAVSRVSVVVLMVLIAGCSSAGTTGSTSSEKVSVDPASGTASGSISSDSPTEIARSQATTAYLGMWQDMAAAAKTSDWNAPNLARYATDDALSAISRGMYADHLNGLVTKGAPKNSPKVNSVTPSTDPTTVMISDCGPGRGGRGPVATR
ncbi:hypothetical protein ACFYR1_48820 [Streptomyces canus]|uniref:hypothetical protein n=1 Tax=Streptomyces canus TaxID=58343 RepID=UPI0036968B2F